MELLPIEFWILLVVFLFWSLLHELWCLNGSVSPRPAPFRLAYFAPIPRWQQPVLIGFGSLLVAGGAVVVAATFGPARLETGELECGGCRVPGDCPAAGIFWMRGELPAAADDGCSLHGAEGERLPANFRLASSQCALWCSHRFTWRLFTSCSGPTAFLLSGAACTFRAECRPCCRSCFYLGECIAGFGSACEGFLYLATTVPLLPGKDDLILRDEKQSHIMPMFSFEQAQLPTEDGAMPIGKQYLLLLGLILPIVLIICAVVLQGAWLRTLGELFFGRYVFFWLMLCIAMVLADTAQSWLTWLRLHELLLHLDRLPVRRTLYALQGLSWRSVWAMSGNVLTERYSLVSRQIEALRHLRESGCRMEAVRGGRRGESKEIAATRLMLSRKTELKKLVDWYVNLNGAAVTSVEALEAVQKQDCRDLRRLPCQRY